MNATLTNTERRAADGKFANCPGPGRPSKRLLALHERYAAKTASETIQRLALDVERLTAELAEADQKITSAEAAFVESIGPDVQHREHLASLLARARMCSFYLADPGGFGDRPDVRGELDRGIRSVEDQLKKAEEELRYAPPPGALRSECLADDRLWTQLRAYEVARDRVADLRKQYTNLQRELAEANIVAVGVASADGGKSRPRTHRRADDIGGF